MERVAFLLEDTNERLGALLNPESLVMRRTAGVRPRSSAGGQLTGVGLSDDPLLYTGGGRTELELELLFDVSLLGSTVQTDNVRDLTAPLWALAENVAGGDGYGQPRRVRFVWGKAWNMAGVITAVAERLERFTAEGAPQRSWLTMRLLRLSEPLHEPPTQAPLPDAASLAMDNLPTLEELNASQENVQIHEVICGGEDVEGGRGSGERLDQIAARYYGNPGLWRLVAQFNNIEDPNHVPCGSTLVIPPMSVLDWML